MYVRPDALPADIRESLAAQSRGQPREGFAALVLEGIKFKLLRILVGSVLLGGTVAYVSNQYWIQRRAESNLHLVLSVLGGLLLVSGLRSLLGLWRGPFRPALIHGHGLLILTGRGPAPVLIRPLAELTAKDHGGALRHRITLDFGAERVTVRSDNRDAFGFWLGIPCPAQQGQPPPPVPAEGWWPQLAAAGVPTTSRPGWFLPGLASLLVLAVLGGGLGWGASRWARIRNIRNYEGRSWEQVESSRKRDLSRQHHALEQYLFFAERHDPALLEARYQDVAGLREVYEKWNDEPYSPSKQARQERVLFLRGIHEGWRAAQRSDIRGLLEAYTPFTAHSRAALEGYDDVCFQEALEKKTAGALREYRRDFEKGRHREDAREVLRDMYRQAEARYLENAPTTDAPPAAVEGMKSLLAYLREHDPEALQVPVCFLPVEGLEGGRIEDFVRALTGSKKVHPVSPAFSKAANQTREHRIVSHMDQALRWVVGDLFRLATGSLESSRDRPRILVGYQVVGTGIPYTMVAEKDLAREARNVYVGIALDFQFSLQVPAGDAPLSDDPAEGHHFPLRATPAPNFSAAGRNQGPEAFARAVYDAMAETAFAEVTRRLARQLGLERSKK